MLFIVLLFIVANRSLDQDGNCIVLYRLEQRRDFTACTNIAYMRKCKEIHSISLCVFLHMWVWVCVDTLAHAHVHFALALSLMCSERILIPCIDLSEKQLEREEGEAYTCSLFPLKRCLYDNRDEMEEENCPVPRDLFTMQLIYSLRCWQ